MKENKFFIKEERGKIMNEKSLLKQKISSNEKYILMLVMFLPCFLINRNLDNDIWFLLSHGRYVFENGFPHIEPFTIHQGFEFVMQQWLSACIFWITYVKVGSFGLHLLVIIFYILTVYFIFKLCMRVSESNFFISFSLSLLASIYLRFFMVHRPYIFSSLIIVLELYFLESYIFSKSKKPLYILPILSILLVNLQAAMWPILFIILIPYIIDSFKFKIGPISGQGYDKVTLFLIIFLMVIIAFINPYGLDAMTYTFRSYGYIEINSIINEMKPANINTILGLFYYSSILFIILIYSSYKNGRTRLRYVLLSLGIGYMALSSMRNFSLFAICVLFPLAYYLKDYYFPTKKYKTTSKSLYLRKILISLIILVFIVSLLIIRNPNYIYKKYDLLNATIDYMLKNKDSTPLVLYTGYNDGNLCRFRKVPSYIDTRAEIFLKKNNKQFNVMKEYYLLQNGKLYYKDFLNKYQFTYLIVTKSDSLYVNLKNDTNYRVVYTNLKYFLFERKK